MQADDDLIARMRDRAAHGRRANGAPRGPLAVLTPELEAASLARLGFVPPPLLLRAWREVANGGFGPRIGILGLGGGLCDWRGRSALEVYEWLREEDDGEDLMPGEALIPPEIPEGVLPFCYLGGTLFFCVDCRGGEAVLLYDGDADDNRLQTTQFELRGWFSHWLAGHSFWSGPDGG